MIDDEVVVIDVLPRSPGVDFSCFYHQSITVFINVPFDVSIFEFSLSLTDRTRGLLEVTIAFEKKGTYLLGEGA